MSNFNFPGEGKDGSNFDTKQALRTGSRRTDKACGEQKEQFYNISINRDFKIHYGEVLLRLP